VFEFVCAVVVFCRELSKEPGVDRQIAWQLAAAATSVGSNLEEANPALPPGAGRTRGAAAH
jgi:hypothetical protein